MLLEVVSVSAAVCYYASMGSGIEVVLKAQPLATLWGFPVTNALVMTWGVMLLLIGPLVGAGPPS